MPNLDEQHLFPDPLLSPWTKTILESFGLGRWVLRVGRSAKRFLRNIRNPVYRKLWKGYFVFPVRNVILQNEPVTIRFGEISLQMVPAGAVACQAWSGLRCEHQEVAFILSMLESGMIFFDVGANAGLFAISAAQKIGGNRVFAFEPCASTRDILERNLRLNRIAGVRVAPHALWDSVGEAVLQVNSRGKDGLNTLGQASHPDSEVVAQEKVSVTTLDVFISQQGISRVDVIKADIEGAELMLFRGAKDLLGRDDAPLILYEGFGFLTRGFGYHPVEILWLLESCGYELFTLNNDTGAISELKPDYQYDSMVIAAKPGHPSYAKVRARVQ